MTNYLQIFSGTIYRGAYHYHMDHETMQGYVRYNGQFFVNDPDDHFLIFSKMFPDYRMLVDLLPPKAGVDHRTNLQFATPHRVGIAPNRAFVPWLPRLSLPVPTVFPHTPILYVTYRRLACA